jgi:valyl-tRNA synthetase
MSKSLGNTIDPLDVIRGITLDELVSKTETYPVPEKLLPKVVKGLKKEYPDGIPSSGADGLRFTLASLSGQGRDIKLSIPRVAGYRAFLNKIWNATRFALMRLPEGPVSKLNDVRADLNLADRWILSQLQAAIAKANHGMSHYRFDEVANTIYHFFWNDFCDWYIELSKSALSDEATETQKRTTASVLVHVLDESMRLLHPICPFQSEEIWQKLPGIKAHWASQNIHFCARAPYPQKDDSLVDAEAAIQMQWVQNAITLIRNTRQESGLPAQKKVPVHLLVSDEKVLNVFQGLHTEIMRLALLTDLQFEDPKIFTAPKYAATNASENFDLVIPLEGLIDLDAERNRLKKEIEKVQKEAFGLGKRLGNEKFVAQAPPEVVGQAQHQHRLLEEKRTRLEASLSRLS